ncbi:hypothetical protein, partial [Xanthomonas fragariae]|uniref:hypothetical protein n=4 Tax=Xanthomonas fragariae TaxID=48664 RepID=UPI001F303086
ILNSSVYRLLLMDTSQSAIFHGLEMSRRPWAYHALHDGRGKSWLHFAQAEIDGTMVYKDGQRTPLRDGRDS